MCNEGIMEEVDRLHQQMLQRNMVPDGRIYNLISHGYAKCGDEFKALSLQKEMVERGMLTEEMSSNNLVMDKIPVQM